MNKKGQGLSISTIILIILGVIVLVILVLGFSIGWSNIVPYVSQSNANTISSQCSVACTTSSIYDFCSRAFDLSAGITQWKNVTCNFLAQPQYSSKYGVSPCSSVSCSNIVILDNANNQYTKANFNSQSVCSTDSSYSGKVLQTLISNTLYSINC